MTKPRPEDVERIRAKVLEAAERRARALVAFRGLSGDANDFAIDALLDPLGEASDDLIAASDEWADALARIQETPHG